ncbi:uncharacterized protein O3C94_009739 [Discoglossus pictus]
MSRHISRNFALSGCHVGTQREHHPEFRAPLTADTSYTSEVDLSSAVQIGQRLAVIGDELHRTCKSRHPSKIGHLVLASMRIANHCQAFVLSVLRSIKQSVCRVDHGETRPADNPPLVPASEPDNTLRTLLFALVLVAVSGLLISLASND